MYWGSCSNYNNAKIAKNIKKVLVTGKKSQKKGQTRLI